MTGGVKGIAAAPVSFPAARSASAKRWMTGVSCSAVTSPGCIPST
jgi:hypothetical protein